MVKRFGLRLAACGLRLLLLASVGCGARGAGGTADKFVDKYYVEFDQEAALPLTDQMAKLKLESEIKLVGSSRNGIAPGALAAKVYWKRKQLSESNDSAQADYALTIKPQGGSSLERETHIELQKSTNGEWRVIRFNESAGH
jgi:hypothetical protein